MPKLSVYRNREHLFNYYLEEGEIVVGRSHEADIALDSTAISRRHIRFRRHGSTYTVEDLSQKNGMFVNGQFTNAHILQDGDRIELPQHILVFHRPDSEILEETQKSQPSHQFKMTTIEMEQLLDTTAEVAEEAGEQVDSLTGTTFLSGKDLENLQVSSEASRKAHLAWIDGSRHQLPLGETIVRIGWTDNCDIQLPSGIGRSGVAARVSPLPDEGGHILQAICHWPAVKVAGERVELKSLAEGDVIEIGGTKIRYRTAVPLTLV